MNFADRLLAAAQKKSAPLCVSLDTRLDLLPNFLQKKYRKSFGKTFNAASEALLEFNMNIINAIADLAIAVKLSPAFYEVFASEGMYAYRETLKYAQKKGLLTIANLSVSLSGPAAEACAATHLGMVNLFGELTTSLCADAVILNAFDGFDSVQPFLDKAEHYKRGVFVVLHTASLSANQIQETALRAGPSPTRAEKLFEHLADLINQWGRNHMGVNGFSSVGAVVDSTYPTSALELRKRLPNALFLVTDYGYTRNFPANLRPLFDEQNQGALISASQSVIYAYERYGLPEEEYAAAARRALEGIVAEVQMRE